MPYALIELPFTAAPPAAYIAPRSTIVHLTRIIVEHLYFRNRLCTCIVPAMTFNWRMVT
jgi:hypothetical protein